MIRIIARDLFYKGSYGIWVVKQDDLTGKHWIAKPAPLEFEESNECAMLPEPTFEFKRGEHKEFLNAFAIGLSEAGYQHEDKSVYGERNAMKKHLEDLQKYMDRLLKP